MYEHLGQLFVALNYFLVLYLHWRQYVHTKKATGPPDIYKNEVTDEEFKKSKEYHIVNSHFSFVKDFFSLVYNLVEVFFIHQLWELVHIKNEYLHSLCFNLMLSIVQTISLLPFKLYRTFVIEERFGFNKYTLKFFFYNVFLEFCLMALFANILNWIIMFAYNVSGQWFIIVSVFAVMILVLLIQIIFPIFILPLFIKLYEFPQGNYRDAVTKFCQDNNFPIKNLYIFDFSKRTTKANAMVLGLFTHTIAIADNAIPIESLPPELQANKSNDEEQDKIKSEENNDNPNEKTNDENTEKNNDENTDKTNDKNDEKCSPEEILAILGHEVGHSKNLHLWKGMVINLFTMLLTVLSISIVMSTKQIFTDFGFDGAYIAVGIILSQYLISPIESMLQLPLNYIQRHFEYQADTYAATRGLPISEVLIKLNKGANELIEPDPLYSTFSDSHPTLSQRIKNINKVKAKAKID